LNAAPPTWDLSDLFLTPADPRLLGSLNTVRVGAEAFATRYRGNLASLSPTALAEAIASSEQLQQEASRASAYAALRFAADTSPESGALLQKVREAATAATLPLLFFSIELAALSVKHLEALQAEPMLSTYAHYLGCIKDEAQFRLSEPEERILAETANTGPRALVRLFEETVSNITVAFEGRELTLPEALDLQRSPERSQRERSAEALTNALEKQNRTIAFLYNNLVQAKATEDRLRGYRFPEHFRHLSNELDPAIPETVASVVESGYPLVARYYQAKQRLLGLETLYHYDRYAPIDASARRFTWAEAQETILSAFERFDGSYRAAAQSFFDHPWIDGAPRKGKRGGAFCSYVTPDHHPYLFTNFLGKPDDVQTLAHELGHGIHSLLSRGQTLMNFHGTLPMAEVASTLAEQVVFAALLEQSDPAERRALYAQRIESSFATIFRQITMYRFEQAVHTERASGELSAARLATLWQEKLGSMFGNSVTLGEGHGFWWSYVGHFFHSPFYVYAYAFGEMLALALYTRYQEQGASFVPKYLEMLSKGGSQSPQDLVAPLGVTLADEGFWLGALRVLEEEIVAFEALAS
jgi:oligoendopeptidase F